MASSNTSRATGFTHAGLGALALCMGFVGSFGGCCSSCWAGWGLRSGARLMTQAWPRSRGMGVMALYALLLYLSPWWSSSYYLSWETGLILAALPIAYLAWQFTPDQDRVWQALRRLFLPFCWVIASWGIASVLIEGRPRALGPVTDPNVFAGFINLLWFPLLAECFGREGGLRLKADRAHGCCS